jgi:hypothetical protein
LNELTQPFNKREYDQGPMLWFFKYFHQQKSTKKFAFLAQNKTKVCKILIITLVFDKNAIFCRKLSKIAENCDHNIDPWSVKYLQEPWIQVLFF